MQEETEEISVNGEYPQMALTEEMQYFIFEIAKWARLLSVFGFVFSAFLALISFTISSAFPLLVKASPTLAAIPGGAKSLTIFYFLIALVSFFFSFYLFQFAKGAKDGITYNSEERLTTAFNKLKSFFKLWGILALGVVGLYILTILGGLFGAGA